jgi:tRNA(adenine34) deaminase
MLPSFFLALSITFWIRPLHVESFFAHTTNNKLAVSYQWLKKQHQLESISSISILNLASVTYAPELHNTTARHRTYMQMALQQAKLAGEKNEVPIGAVIVRRCRDGTFQVLSQACNSMESTNDASAHAELLAMRKAAKKIGNWRLLNSTLYSTLEPCPMCLAAAQAFRIEEIVYGAPDLRLGAIETYMRMLDYNHPMHNIDLIVPGVLKEESADMMREFFRGRRTHTKRNPPPLTAKISRLSRWRKALFRKPRWFK